jgi:hypothetical protein
VQLFFRSARAVIARSAREDRALEPAAFLSRLQTKNVSARFQASGAILGVGSWRARLPTLAERYSPSPDSVVQLFFRSTRTVFGATVVVVLR